MTEIPATETDQLQLYQQLSVRLAEAPTAEAVAAACAEVLERALGARLLQIVWDAGPVRRLFGPRAEEPARQPDALQLAALARGELVLDGDGSGACYAPLRVRGTLSGWIWIEDRVWAPESDAFVLGVAAQTSTALAMLALADEGERAVQLQMLNEVGRLLGGGLDLNTLLEAIYSVTTRLVDAPNFYIALYDRDEDVFDLAYLVSDGQRISTEVRWSSNEGLAGTVVRERRPLCVANYLAECERRGLQPRNFGGFNVSRAWLGVPLIVRDEVIGVMTVGSPRDGYTYSESQVELFVTIAAQAAVAIENARLYQRSDRQARQLAALNRIGRTITSSLDPERVPSLIMEQVSELLNVEEGSLLLTDDESGELVFAYTIGPVGSQLIGTRLAPGIGIAGYVVATGQSVFSNDVRQDARFDDSTDRSTGYTTRALLATPLRGVGGVRGVIEVLNRRDGAPFTHEDLRLLEAVADYAVIALENARRFGEVDKALARRAEELAQINDQLQHNLRSLTALNALGMAIHTALRTADEIFAMTARGVAEMTGALGAAVLVPNEGGFRSVVHVGDAALPVPPANTLERVVESGRPEVTQELQPQRGPVATLIVPLRATQRTLGCMCVYYERDVPPAPDRETVALFATQAAGAVESIELFTAVRTARDEMASILASTREGIMLIGADARVAVANAALHQLCGLRPEDTHGATVAQFLEAWERATLYLPEDWVALRRGLDAVLAGSETFASGALTEGAGPARFVEWTVLTVHSSGGDGAASGGALLVLRDITEARESEQMRQDLTHMIVHDLRSPLSSMMASVELLLRGVSGPLTPSQHHILNIANASAQQMLEMINTLLDINRLEAGRMPLTLAACDVGELVGRAAEQLASLAQDKRIELVLDLPEGLPSVPADSGLVVRVVQNLVANAIKFSGRGSSVHISARATAAGEADHPAICISVRDQGIGIAPKDRDKIFAKFGQVGERRGGSGLGLTFCKLVVEAHGGRIWVESELGQGSTFFFTIPQSL
ncbi:MAG: GAF domain-containing protein [Chloroflexota bacterium]|nr:MAG: histidine kinase [Chloroflexota bacterium]